MLFLNDSLGPHYEVGFHSELAQRGQRDTSRIHFASGLAARILRCRGDPNVRCWVNPFCWPIRHIGEAAQD